MPFAFHAQLRAAAASARSFALAAGTAVAVALAGPAAAEDLVVKYDQSQLLRLPKPVAEIIIGNPTIADVTIQSSNMLVVTGKSFGITNIIALDNERNIIQDQRVMVIREESKVVSVQKGGKRESYNCAPQCNPALVVGDDQPWFENVAKMAQRKIGFSEGAADRNSQANNNQ
jgi:hypothetical protein